jgi:prepilin signal peptidase PulO-like enzyme (type II secretory pathway)
MIIYILPVAGFILGNFTNAIADWLLAKFFTPKNRPKHAYSFLPSIATALMFLIVGLQFSDPFIIIAMCAFAICLVILNITDFREYIIPDEVQLVMLLIGLFLTYYQGEYMWYKLLNAMVLVGVGLILRGFLNFSLKKESLGWGDVKMLAISGFYVNIDSIAIFLFLSGFLGLCLGIVWRMFGRGEAFPFGPALGVALFACACFPNLRYLITDGIAKILALGGVGI